tara:strand:+ start:155 stop:502 length:348 start_codon:yes stop_codon:yes gene_type:complete
MNPTTELLSKLNTMQSEHIKLLNERIDKQAKKIESYSSAIDGMHIVIKELKGKESKLIFLCDTRGSFVSFAKDRNTKQIKLIKELKNKVKVLSNACKGKDKLIYKLKNELRSNKE